ncbi:uncharacterized protein LOC141908135 [Tubulanus polymorphus]|uniref:uncharacterized protein LOC141908135 n=1 Tax=Tubulanus polymorphus TaxID=672921 RepID=UPI003DA555C5
MVYQRSEYRRSFLRSPTKYLSEDFEQKYDYRSFRRQVEHQHHSIDWDTLSTASSEAGSEFVIPSPRVPASSRKAYIDPPHIQKFKAFQKYWAEKQKQQVEEKREEKQEIKDKKAGKVIAKKDAKPVQEEVKLVCKPVIERAVQVDDFSEPEDEGDLRIENLELNEDEVGDKNEEDHVQKTEDTYRLCPVEKLNVEEDTAEVDEEEERPKEVAKSTKKIKQKKIHVTMKPRRPYLYKKIPKARPSTAPPSRSKKTEIENEKPLFVAWGAGDQEYVVGDKKTYNVRCPVEVHPNALRAAKRRQELKQKKDRTSKTSARVSKRTQNLFDELMNRETANWDTEYRRNFSRSPIK